jgi:hypothetical protein
MNGINDPLITVVILLTCNKVYTDYIYNVGFENYHILESKHRNPIEVHYISKINITSIFRAKEKAKQVISRKRQQAKAFIYSLLLAWLTQCK